MASTSQGRGNQASYLTHQFELCPDFSLKAFFFANVTNAEQLVKDHEHGEMVVFIDLDMLPGPFTLLSAANKAVVSHVEQNRKTSTLGTECLYNLGISKSIDKAVKLFSPGEATENVAAVVFIDRRQGKPKESGEEASSVLFSVQGTWLGC